MAYSFGTESKKQYGTLHPKLQKLMDEMIKFFDFSIIEGHRGESAQNRAFAVGNSKVRWPHGKHNKKPSRAVDIAPYPIDWSNKIGALMRFGLLMGVAIVCAAKLGIKIRLGMDWNRNGDPRDETFIDYPHIELDESEK
jgi:peptidoglycan L-alanyl-D-glutamate endopeptidase CwlK